MKLKYFAFAFMLWSTITLAQEHSEENTNKREGFLFEFSFGAGLISIEDSEAIQTFDTAQGALSFPELKFGYMINNQLAITAVLPGMIYKFQDNDRHFGGFIPSIQYWFKDKWWINGGIGLVIDGPALYDINDNNDDFNFGCAIMASTGYNVYKKNDFSIHVQSKLILGRAFLENDAHRDAISLSVGLGFCWL